MQHAQPNRLRRAVSFAVFAAVLGLVSFTLSHCTLVGDSTTGVSIDRNGPNTCPKQCTDALRAAQAECAKNHESAKEACRLLPEPDRTACEMQAGADRKACSDAAEAQKDECLNACHRQGSGSAG